MNGDCKIVTDLVRKRFSITWVWHIDSKNRMYYN